MKILLRLVIALISIFFAFGAIAAWLKWIDVNLYVVLTGVVGSVASVFGLVALTAKPITTRSIREVEAELLGQLAEQVRKLKEYDEQLVVGQARIDKMAKERAELEILVRQASLKAFLEERLRNISTELEGRIRSDTSITRLLDDYQETLKRAEEIDATIERSDRADLVREIISGLGENFTSRYKPMYLRVAGVDMDIGPLVYSARRILEVYLRAFTLR